MKRLGWFMALVIGLNGKFVLGWGESFVEVVKDTGAQLDPTNPNGSVRKGADALARGAQDPLKVVREVRERVEEIGAVIGDLGRDPLGTLRQAVSQFTEEVGGLNFKIDFLKQLNVTLPDVKAPEFLNIQMANITDCSLPNVNLGNVDFPIQGFQDQINRLDLAGKAIERFFIKDIPRETKRFGRDVNREGRKAGRTIDTEVNNCFNGGCFPFGEPSDDCENKVSQIDRRNCYEAESKNLRKELSAWSGKRLAVYTTANTIIVGKKDVYKKTEARLKLRSSIND